MKQIALDIGLASAPTLENFCAGPNEAALAHLRLWTSGRTRSPVPTYLWGASGSGKTHLLRAVGEVVRAQGASVGWLDAQTGHDCPFDERWAMVLMDDVQRYDTRQQHTAFSWFVQAQALQRGVLAAGALPPADLGLREDLRTRLGWGHVFELQPLSDAQRRAVLRQAADARGLFLADEVIDYILARFSRDLRTLMDLLDQLDHYALQTQRPITIPLLRAMLQQDA